MGNKVREARMRAGLTMEQLGERAGVHFSTIAKIERSIRGLTGEMLYRLATALDMPPADLLDEVPAFLPVRMVPVIGRIAAGDWREAVAEAIGHIPVSMGGQNAFALQPDGDSMDQVVSADAYIVVDPDILDLRDGGLYAVMNGDGDTTFKRYRSEPPRLEPVSSNPEHKPIPLGREPFTVIGRVVGTFSSL